MQNNLKQKFKNWEEALRVLRGFLRKGIFYEKEFLECFEEAEFPTQLFKNKEFRELTGLIFGKEYLVEEEVKSYGKLVKILSNLDLNLLPINLSLRFLVRWYKEVELPFYTAPMLKKLTEALEEIYSKK